MNNVIQIDPATFYCMRQCQESIKNLTPLVSKNPIYQIEINGEKEMYKHFMSQTIKRAA